MINPEQAAVLADVPTRLVYRWVEDGRLHLIERSDLLLVCLNSLKASVTSGLDETNVSQLQLSSAQSQQPPRLSGESSPEEHHRRDAENAEESQK